MRSNAEWALDVHRENDTHFSLHFNSSILSLPPIRLILFFSISVIARNYIIILRPLLSFHKNSNLKKKTFKKKSSSKVYFY